MWNIVAQQCIATSALSSFWPLAIIYRLSTNILFFNYILSPPLLSPINIAVKHTSIISISRKKFVNCADFVKSNF